ncbi:MAG: AI-2E family transporter [Bdellovibrionales bacterium]
MRRGQDFEKNELERKLRRKYFYRGFGVLSFITFVALVWSLRSLLLPITVGALLAFLFRPLKDRFRIPWLPHEVQTLSFFAAIGLALFAVISTVRTQIPDERQALELKVRVKYKLNEKYTQLFSKKEKETNPIIPVVAREAAALMNQVNRWLELSPIEIDLFLKYRTGYRGQKPIEDRYFEYFQANLTTNANFQKKEQEASMSSEERSSAPSSESASVSGVNHDALSAWLLAPLVFFFLSFDSGQIRRYFIGLVPNRYFELSLTVLDMLDDAIGKYLRGTFMECGLVGLTLASGLCLLGLPVSVAIAIGVVSGLVNAIPFLGTVFGLIIGLGYALIAENVQPLIPGLNPEDLALYVLVLVGLAHVLDNVVFQPFVLGGAINLHPMVVIVAILGGSVIMGLWGMLLAIPTVVIVKTAVETLIRELKDYRII